MTYKEALDNFINNSDDFKRSVVKSTKASWGGSWYAVELFNDGVYRVMWSSDIGDKYISPGIILPIPALTDYEWEDYLIDEDDVFMDNVIDQLRKDLEFVLSERNKAMDC